MNKKEKQVKQQAPTGKVNTNKNQNSNNPKPKQQQQQHGKKAAPNQSEDVQRQQKLQAILLADSFSVSFRPITMEGPKVLLPLVNVPMIEYTLEFLAQNGVEEIFIFCVWHADKIQDYINKSKWPSILSVKCINSPSCQSAGDALRELDTLNVIRSDPFILISGDVISNINLKEAIAFHKIKRKEDSNNVLTIVLKKVQKVAGAKPILDDLTIAMNRNSSQIVLFENSFRKKNVKISLELMQEHPAGLNFYTDLLDCNVDICSPEFMMQFSDNFDYQDIRKDFIQNEVGNWSLGKHIYGYLIQNEYAARVQDFRSYHSICRDIVTRWVFPLVPDAQLVPGSNYIHTKRYSYRESGVKVSRSAIIGEGVVLSRGTVVGDNTVLQRVIIGRDCIIGKGVTISESHLWNSVVIEDNVNITQSIICDNVVVSEGVVVPKGCILSHGTKIGTNAKLLEYSQISTIRSSIENDGDVDNNNNSNNSNSSVVAMLGSNSIGGFWKSDPNDELNYLIDEDDDDKDNDDNNVMIDLNYIRMRSIGCKEEEQWKKALWNTLPLPESESDSDTEEDYGESGNHTASINLGAGVVGGGGGFMMDYSGDGASARDCLHFASVVEEMVTTGYAEGHPASSLLMEIKGYKFAQNKSFGDCIRGIIPALLAIIVQNASSSSGSGAISTSSSGSNSAGSTVFKQKLFLDKWRETVQEGTITTTDTNNTGSGWGYTLLKPMLQDIKEEIEMIEAIEDLVLSSGFSVLFPLFRYIMQICFEEEELISEDGILQWASLRESMEDDFPLEIIECSSEIINNTINNNNNTKDVDRMRLFRDPQVQLFVEWIKEDDDDDTDDEEEED